MVVTFLYCILDRSGTYNYLTFFITFRFFIGAIYRLKNIVSHLKHLNAGLLFFPKLPTSFSAPQPEGFSPFHLIWPWRRYPCSISDPQLGQIIFVGSRFCCGGEACLGKFLLFANINHLLR